MKHDGDTFSTFSLGAQTSAVATPPRSLLQDLREDLLDAATGYPEALRAVREAFAADAADLAGVRANCIKSICWTRSPRAQVLRQWHSPMLTWSRRT